MFKPLTTRGRMQFKILLALIIFLLGVFASEALAKKATPPASSSQMRINSAKTKAPKQEIKWSTSSSKGLKRAESNSRISKIRSKEPRRLKTSHPRASALTRSGSKSKPTCYPYASPHLPVRAAILYNMNTGQILYQHNADMVIPPASLTKVMTLFLAFDAIKQGYLSLKKRIKVSKRSAYTGGSSMHLRMGERISLRELIIGTAVASGNDAAMAVAETVNPNLSKFVQMMNRRAKSLGLAKTNFCNPTGLPATGQFTCARDMLKLSLSYLTRHPQVLKFHNLATFYHGGRLLSTTNSLLGAVCGVNGLKTGWTIASGYNIIVTAQRGDTRLLLVVMGGRSRVSRDVTARRLLEAGFRNPRSAKEVRSAFLGRKNVDQLRRRKAQAS